MRRPHRRILLLVVLLLASSAGASEAGSTAPGQQPPAATTAPAITGTPVQGQMLTGSTGSWYGRPTTYSYAWRRCDSAGANCSAISGATSPSYVLTSADAGVTERVVVTASNAGGSASATSAQTAAVAAAAPASAVTLSSS